MQKEQKIGSAVFLVVFLILLACLCISPRQPERSDFVKCSVCGKSYQIEYVHTKELYIRTGDGIAVECNYFCDKCIRVK